MQSPADPLEHTGGPTSIEVLAVPLDPIFAGLDLQRPIVLKFDVQGVEVSVLRSAPLLLGMVDYILLEVSPRLLLAHGESPDSLLRELAAFSLGAVLSSDSPGQTRLKGRAAFEAELRALLRVEDGDDHHVVVVLARGATL